MGQKLALEPTVEADRIGFFGKLPTHGDFVTKDLSRTVQNALDAWLQAGLAAAQNGNQQAWEQTFRKMPSWRFVIPRGVWGPATVAGVIVPSRDRVGRRFPLVVAAQLHDFADDPRKLCLDDTWFLALEGIAETTGGRDFDLEVFAANLKRLRRLRPGDHEFDNHPKATTGTGSTFWWRFDPKERQRKGFRTSGAPQPDDFLNLMAAGDQQLNAEDGSTRLPQSARPVAATTNPQPVRQPPAAEVPPFAMQHSQASHPGTRAILNCDALLALDHPPLFAIADGVGEDASGSEAARTVTGILAGAVPLGPIGSLTQEIKGKLGRAHGLLQSAAVPQERRGATASVVALAVSEDRFTAVWAGDARAYLLRHGMMRALTRDHVAIGLRRTLSRGIGLQGPLSPEVCTDAVQKGDRFLLCSNPLVLALGERGIAELILSVDRQDAVEALVQEALIAGCRHNISAIIVDVRAHGG